MLIYLSMKKDSPKMFSTTQAARYLRDKGVVVGNSTVRLWVSQGLFPNAQKQETVAGSVWAIPENDLLTFEPPQRGRPTKKT